MKARRAPTAALQALARAARRRLRGEVIAICGSNGKTSTRAMVQAVVEAASAAEVGASVNLLYFTAPEATLRERIVARGQERSNPSEADLDVLDWQLENFELPATDEPVIDLDTTRLNLDGLREALAGS